MIGLPKFESEGDEVGSIHIFRRGKRASRCRVNGRTDAKDGPVGKESHQRWPASDANFSLRGTTA